MTEEVKKHREELRTLLVTLMVNSYNLNAVERVSPVCSILNVYKYDLFGGETRYSIVLTDAITNTIATRADRASLSYNSTTFGIGKIATDKMTWYTQDLFYNKIGGSVNQGLILNPDLPVLMKQFGHNSLPDGIAGKAEDFLEQYSKECLQYLLQVPVRRYGIDRSFESLPDGVVLGQDLVMIFDAKAYSAGFPFGSDDVNRFEKYVNDFKKKYGHIFPQVNSFLVVSGQFNDSNNSIQGRSNELLSRCQTPICCLTTEDLGKTVQLFLSNPGYRRSIQWKRMFTNIRLKYSEVEAAFRKVQKDQIIN
ncbi:MAG: hypothetical protein AAF388_07045 [Bacteroidota bacterium]